MSGVPLAELLRSARKSRGLNQRDAAPKLGCSVRHLIDLEQGKSDNPTLRMIASIVKVYGILPAAIIATATRGDEAATHD